MIQQRPATIDDIEPIAADMRAMDRVECAAFGQTPGEALWLGMVGSRETYTLTHHGRPVGMVGVVTEDVLNGVGKPWLLATPELMRERRSWAVLGPQIMASLQRGHRLLTNHVHQRNVASIAWLKRLGCQMEAIEIIGGEPFWRFSRCAQSQSL